MKTFVRIRPPARDCVLHDALDEGLLKVCGLEYRFHHVFSADAKEQQIF